MTCPLKFTSEQTEPGRFCPHSNFDIFEGLNVTNDDNIIVEVYAGGDKLTINKDSPEYCVGPSWPIHKESLQNPITMHLFRLEQP